MGYTHYWNRLKEYPKEQFEAFVDDVRHAYGHLPDHTDTAGGYHEADELVICGWNGDGVPEFTNDKVSFNGNKEKGLEHETFHFPRVKKLRNHAEPDETGKYFDFTKTARKPYDLLVCVCLLLAEKHFGSDIEVSSDGDMTGPEWDPARKFLAELPNRVEAIEEDLDETLDKLDATIEKAIELGENMPKQSYMDIMVELKGIRAQLQRVRR